MVSTLMYYIMAFRAVPDGDERDKDIALAIRYAVDNGARVVNMSFGKYFSPGKKWVDEAVRYAEDHDVLLVHAAGNEFQKLDSVTHYPNPEYDSRREEIPVVLLQWVQMRVVLTAGFRTIFQLWEKRS